MIPMEWLWGLLGGLMIGTAAAGFLLIHGRIMGASGILASVLDKGGPGTDRGFFLAGLIWAPLLVALLGAAPETGATETLWLLIAGGLLTGIGTRMAGGCTSGHGVCGISRLSPRGLVASALYIGAGMAVIATLRHGLGVL